MSGLYLIGTNHVDLQGPQRLQKLLGFIRPSQIGLEASHALVDTVLAEREIILSELEELAEFEDSIKSLRKRTGIEKEEVPYDAAFEIAKIMGYEIWATYEHKEVNPDAEIFPIHDEKTLQMLSPIMHGEALKAAGVSYTGSPSAYFPKIFEGYSKQETDEFIDESYQISDEVAELIQQPVHRARLNALDDVMESGIREMLSQADSGTSVVLAGNHHFFGPYGNNLYERLTDFSPQRIRLPEVDKF